MATWTIDEPRKLTFDTVRRLRVRTVAGSVGVVGTDDRPTLEVSELDGLPLRVHGVAGELWAHTVSGDLTLVEGGGTVGARTISGTVTLDVSTPGAGDIRVTTVSGDVTIRLPQASDLQVQVQSTSGLVASAFDELHREGQPALRSIRGGARCRHRTAAGQHHLRPRRPAPPRARGAGVTMSRRGSGNPKGVPR
jgi:DUF4097 and DUF4098 domain-containing protein YvlB